MREKCPRILPELVLVINFYKAFSFCVRFYIKACSAWCLILHVQLGFPVCVSKTILPWAVAFDVPYSVLGLPVQIEVTVSALVTGVTKKYQAKWQGPAGKSITLYVGPLPVLQSSSENGPVELGSASSRDRFKRHLLPLSRRVCKISWALGKGWLWVSSVHYMSVCMAMYQNNYMHHLSKCWENMVPPGQSA